MHVQCLKRPCAIFDEFEPVRKIRLIDHNSKSKFKKTGTDQSLYLSDNITTSRSRQTTCLAVTSKRKRQLEPDDNDSHKHCCTFVSIRKKTKMVIQARDPASVDICGRRSDHVAGLRDVCFESGVPVADSNRPAPGRGRGLDRSDDICSKSTTVKDTGVATRADVEDNVAVFSCFNFWRAPVPDVDLLEELSQDSQEMETERMVECDDSVPMPSDDDTSDYSDFSYWKIPILDLA